MKKDRFFTKLDWAAFWTATIATFAVYFFTLGPSVGLEDSGELATAGAHLGVPHPPGYPFWTLCSWIFCKLFFWVKYMGHPNPAWAISCFSAVAGALAAGCTAMLICRSAHDFICGGDSGEGRDGSTGVLAFGGGVAGALTFALSPVEWSQSTIVEIYSLNALFLMWVFLLSYRWMRKPSDKILWTTAYVFGLGLTNYQVLVFAIVPLALIILMKNASMFRDVFIYLVPVALTYQVLQIGSLQRADAYMQKDVIAKHAPILSVESCPSSTMIAIGLAVLVGSFVFAAIARSRGKAAKARDAALYGGGAGAALVFLAGTLFTSKCEWTGVAAPVAPLVEPWRYAVIGALASASAVAGMVAALQDEDEKLSGPKCLKFVVASAAFALAAILFAVASPVADLAGYRGPQYPWTKSILVFTALVAVLFVLVKWTKRGLCFAIPAAGLQIAVFVLLKNGAMNGLTHPQSWWFAWPVAWNFVLLAMAWIALPNGRSVAGAALFTQLGAAFYAYMPIVSDLRNPPMNWGYPRTWDGFKHAIQRGQYEAIGIPSFDTFSAFRDFAYSQMKHYYEDVKVQFTDLLLPFVPIAFAAGHWAVAKRQRRTFWQWMGAAAACFVMMSFLLLLLANVKGDLQDGFIQKVKFISSHAMVALWIGYGLVFAAALAVRFVPAKLLAAAMVAVAFAAPLVDNYCGNYRLGVNEVAYKFGASEQNGHTFGWQFGAYQLDGAKAIKEQLVEDEEPLPDPGWPEAMEPFSIFFGGTDPGRFVPTYMIYSADFRPDVYLITQNALADDTYMSVERDLYGDEIWIPSKEDSSEAFNIYIDEVQRGVRPANGDLRIENGRVQVIGALGVMEINGILTKMMFDHDRLRHSFYVEESYVIPWMYPYLSPHGLIMKINPDMKPYDPKTADKDADFWDWYVRRLLKDPAYRRDFAGQKAFCKLRSAIAGLYARQGRRRESAQAYREACVLYPPSPEGTTRYIRDVLVPTGRWHVALDILDSIDHLDPNNRRTSSFRSYVTHLRDVTTRVGMLEAKARSGKEPLTKEEKLDLVQCYFSIGNYGVAAHHLESIADALENPAEIKFAGEVFAEAGNLAAAEKHLDRYLAIVPRADARAWIRIAKIRQKLGKRSAALTSARTALSIDAALVNQAIRDDKELYEILLPLLKQYQRSK